MNYVQALTASKKTPNILKGSESGAYFRGYVKGPFGRPDRFCDMLNMSGQDYPLIRTRDKRTKLRTLTKCNGIFGREKLGWVDGTTLYYNGTAVTGSLEDSKKTFCSMGAYTLILPDKMIFDSVNLTLSSAENTQAPSGTVTFNPCTYEGAVLTDYSSALYIKISATNIDTGFTAGDVVTISGSTIGIDGDYNIENTVTDGIVILGTMSSASASQTGGLTVSRSMPDMDYVTECDNRIWGCSSANHEIYACKLGDPKNWRSFQGLSTDSYALTIGSVGDFTGAATHLGYVIFFKENVLHKLYGNKPSNYQLTNSIVRGVAAGSSQSIVTAQETLFYMSPAGAVSYEGAMPQSCDVQLGGVKYTDAVCGAAGTRVFWSLKEGANTYHLFVLDTRTGDWHREDGIRADSFATVENDLYMADSSGNLWCLTGEGDAAYLPAQGTRAPEDTLSWRIDTGDMAMDMANKRAQKILLRYELTAGSDISILLRYDGGREELIRRFRQQDKTRLVSLPIIPRRCDRLALILEGTGEIRLYAVSVQTQGGTELYGH